MKKRKIRSIFIFRRTPYDIEINIPGINEPRIMAMNIKIFGFKLRIVNVYAPTDVNGTETQKQLFYAALNKATMKTEKHHKIIVLGDFNATTSIAQRRCCFDGSKVIEDEDCNDNGHRLKQFCRSKQLSTISATFFKHRMLHRYTWYSNDGRTRKILDYVLTEKYVQQHITDCRVMRGFDADSDHCLLKTSLYTPSTRQARRKYCKNPKAPKPNVKALQKTDVMQKYTETVTRKLESNNSTNNESALSITDRIVTTLQQSFYII